VAAVEGVAADDGADRAVEVAADARAEGFDEIAALFEGVAEIEKAHEARYRKLLENVKNGLVFSREGDQLWQCANCGHIVIGKAAPETAARAIKLTLEKIWEEEA
jgi:rubrerythrin